MIFDIAYKSMPGPEIMPGAARYKGVVARKAVAKV